MNARHSIPDRKSGAMLVFPLYRTAFTLVELLIVIGIIVVLMGMLGVMVGSSMKTARAAATSALIQKLDVLLDDRMKGFDRATKSADFQRIITVRRQVMESGGIVGVSADFLAVVARKDFFKANFPQRFEDLGEDGEDRNLNGVLDPGEDTNGNGTLDNANGVVDRLERVPGVGPAQIQKLQAQGPAIPTNPLAATAVRDATESSELLYYALTQMQVFGVPPVGESEFGTSEVRDTDGDGLLEFVDGWGRPLRFYRWPTRLLKPNGILGADNQPGAAGINDDFPLNTTTDDFLEFGKVSTDDITVSVAHRRIAGYLIDGLPSGPAFPGQWDSLSEDPDDPAGLISTEIKRQFLLSGGATNLTLGVTGFNEMNYPTIDTYHIPLIISAGADGDFGLYPPDLLEDLNGNTLLDAGEDTNGNGFLDYGNLAQVIHGPGGPYDITSSVTSTTTDVISALLDNITNRNRRAGRGK